MANIFFIHSFPFTKEAYIRDEFEMLKGRGHNVKFLDIADLIKKKKFEKNYTPFLMEHIVSLESNKAFTSYLKSHSKDAFIVSDVGLLSKTAWVYTAIFKAGIPYILFENTTLPKIGSGISSKEIRLKWVKFFQRLYLAKLIQKPIELFQYYRAKSMRHEALMIVTSKERLSSEKRALKGQHTTIKYISTLDYVVAQEVKGEALVKEPYAVFVDQYFIHHPDFKTNHIVHSFTQEQYYGELNRFLKAYAQTTGFKVVIASHPRRVEEHKRDFDASFELFYNKTPDLIKHANEVLMHFSTAINFAIIFEKTFILLTSNCFEGSNVETEINMLARFFKVKPCNMTKAFQKKTFAVKTEKIEQGLLEDYQTRFIKHPLSNNDTLGQYILSVVDDLI